MSNKQTGDQGEYLACEFLRKQGYKIVERNFRIRGGEIDIVAEDPTGDLVFVEVKTRHTHEYGPPAESVTPWKIRFLARAVLFYLVQTDQINVPHRIDVVTVDFTDGDSSTSSEQGKLEHIKNITF